MTMLAVFIILYETSQVLTPQSFIYRLVDIEQSLVQVFGFGHNNNVMAPINLSENVGHFKLGNSLLPNCS